MRVLVFLLCLAVAAGQNELASLLAIGGYPIADLGTTPTTTTFAPLNPPTTPMTHRTLFYHRVAALPAAAQGAGNVTLSSQLVLSFSENVANPTNYWLKLDSGYLNLAAGARCTQAPTSGTFGTGATTIRSAAGPNARTVVFTLPATFLANRFDHPPTGIAEDPQQRTYRKACLGVGAAAPAANAWQDTSLWVAVTRPCDTVTANAAGNLLNCAVTEPAVAFTAQDGTVTATTVFTGETQEQEFDRARRTQCCGYAAAVAPNSPLKYGVCINRQRTSTSDLVEDCCGDKPFKPQTEKCCAKYALNAPLAARINFIGTPCKCQNNNVAYDCRNQGPSPTTGDTRGQATPTGNTNWNCCTRTKFDGVTVTGANMPLTDVLQTGLCYDANAGLHKCCDDGNLYDPGTSQCCPLSGLQALNNPCPCSGAAGDCPSPASRCCLQQFPLANPTNLGSSAWQCDKFANWPQGPTVTAQPATRDVLQGQQVLGTKVQEDSVNAAGDFFGLKPEDATAATAAIDRRSTKCFGRCFDPRFQTCCNGVLCVQEYQRCCNATCCNKFTGSCVQGYKSAPHIRTNLPSKHNPLDYNIPFEVCTEKENLTVQRSFLVFVLPTLLLFATLASLAIVIVVARRATEEIFELTERTLVLFATVLVFLATPFYFSPVYKYGVVLAFTGLFVIVTAVIRSRSFSLTAIFVLVVLLLFLVDPFNGNIYLSFPGDQTVNTGGFQEILPPTTNFRTNQYFGILEAVVRLSPTRGFSNAAMNEMARQGASEGAYVCTSFYDFFVFDIDAWRVAAVDPWNLEINQERNRQGPHDHSRIENPRQRTFGYCSRAWITALVVFAAVEILLSLVILMLSVFSYVKRMERKQQQEYAPVHIDVTKVA